MSNRWRSSRATEARERPRGAPDAATAAAVAALVGVPAGNGIAPGAAPALVLAAILLGTLAILLSRRRAGGGVVAAVVAVGLLLAARANDRLVVARADARGPLARLDGQTVRGVVRLDGFPVALPDGSRRLPVEVERLAGGELRGVVGTLRVAGASASLVDGWLPGERWELLAAVRTPPDEESDRLPALPRVSLFAKSAALARPLPSRPEAAPLAAELNGELERRLRLLASGDPGREGAADLVAALLLGRPGEMDPSSRSLWRRTGLAHFLSISGFHVAILLLLVDRLGAAAGLSLGKRLLGGAAVAVAFVPFAGASAPLVRAASVALLVVAARGLERPTSGLALLSAAAVAELAVRPESLFDPGFQLTYAAATGLVLAAQPIRRAIPALPGVLAEPLAVTFAAELGVAPVVLAQFGTLPVAGFAANLAVLPLLLAAGGAGVAALGIGTVVPAAGRLLLGAAAVPLAGGEWVAGELARLPGAVLRPAPLPALLLGGAAVATLAMIRRPGWPRLVRLLPLPVALAGFSWPVAGVGAGELRVALLDVGQGDAVVIRSGAASLLVDGGGRTHRDPESFAEGELLPRLARLGVGRLDAAILSHPHPDHCLGLIGVVAIEPPAELILPRVEDFGDCLSRLRREAERGGVPVREVGAGDRLTVGDLRLEVLAPGSRVPRGRGDPINEASLVLRVVGEGGSALLPGDQERGGEGDLVASGVDLSADLLKVPHHGSRTSSTEPFLDAVSPRVALAGCGRRNSFGHPAPEVVARYRRRGVPFLPTSRWRTIEVTLRRDTPSSVRSLDD